MKSVGIVDLSVGSRVAHLAADRTDWQVICFSFTDLLRGLAPGAGKIALCCCRQMEVGKNKAFLCVLPLGEP